MAIKILITLEGSEEVKSSLNEMAKSGEAFMQQFEGLSGKTPLAELSSDLEKAKPAIESTRQVTHGFAEALRVVIPSLRLAGVEVGNFAGFARLASVGIGGLAVAITGAVVVALAELEDKAKRTQTVLGGLFGGKELGAQAFAGLKQAADDLSTSVDSMAPALQSLTTAWQRFVQSTQGFKFVALKGIDLPEGLSGNLKNLTTSLVSFEKILRASGLTAGEADKAAKAFFDTMKQGGKLTADALKQLEPGAVQLIAQAMGRGAITAEQFIAEVSLAPIPIRNLLEALQRFGPQADQAFRKDGIRGFRDALQDLLNVITTTFTGKPIGFSDFVVNELDKIAAAIKATKDELQWIRDWVTWIEQKTAIPLIGQIVQQAMPAPATQQQTTIFDQLPERLKQSFRDAPKAVEDAYQTIIDDSQRSKQEIDSIWSKPIFGAKGFLPDKAELSSALDSLIQLFKQKVDELQSSIVSPAGAAEFTGGPLLQQQQLAQTTQPIVAPFQEADQQIRTIWQTLVEYITGSLTSIDFSPLTQALVQPFTNALPGIRDALLQVENMIREIVRQALEAGQIIQQLNQGGRPGGGGGGGFIEIASGGYIRGPGTTTSDSIPAWLSNREYVIQAKAVDHYGASLFAALNSMRLPKDLFGSFAVGGLAKALSSAMPRYATGGMATATASSGRSLTIVLDGQRFGLNGSADVIDKLERVATMQGIASIGRPPGWVR